MFQKYIVFVQGPYETSEEEERRVFKATTLEEAQVLYREECKYYNVQDIIAGDYFDYPNWYPRRVYLCEIKEVSPTNQEIEDFKNSRISEEIEDEIRYEELALLEKLKKSTKGTRNDSVSTRP